jgi:uncharacterized protein
MNRRALFTPAASKFNLEKSSGYFLPVTLFELGLGSTASYALDGITSTSDSAPAIGRAPAQVGMLYSGYLREWLRARRRGDNETARSFLEDAARDGDGGAAWEFGRMYADGDGVKQNHRLAFEYFSGIADSHADEPTGTGQARLVADAFVRLGSYYLAGAPNSDSKPNAVRGRDMFNYTTSHFWRACRPVPSRRHVSRRQGRREGWEGGSPLVVACSEHRPISGSSGFG